VFSELEAESRAALARSGVPSDSIALVRSADLRYVGQEYHLSVPCENGGSALDPEELVRSFNAAHERIYGYATPEFDVQLVNLRLIGVGGMPRASLPGIPPRDDGGSVPVRDMRPVYFSETGFQETPIYDVDAVRAGDRLPGPSILEDPRSTMVILPGQHGEIDELRNLHIWERDA
jgi:N-methylhydantoinase A